MVHNASRLYLNFGCWTTFGQQACVVAVPLVCLDLLNIAGVDGITGGQNVHNVL